MEPISEPARTLYRVLVAEAVKRKGRSPQDWIRSERQLMFETANSLAKSMGLVSPTYNQVVSAEISACGHVDYAAKFAYGVAQVMTAFRGMV